MMEYLNLKNGSKMQTEQLIDAKEDTLLWEFAIKI